MHLHDALYRGKINLLIEQDLCLRSSQDQIYQVNTSLNKFHTNSQYLHKMGLQVSTLLIHSFSRHIILELFS